MRYLVCLFPMVAACTSDRANATKPPPMTSSVAVADVTSLAPAAVTFANGRLHGYLYRPAGNGPFPAIVFNHGSEPEPGEKRGQAQFFVPHGYVLFVPHRRGQGLSRTAGAYVGDVANDGPQFVAGLDAQEEDIGAAITFLAEQPFVDAHRIAVSGCSLGGIESLFAAERETKIRAAVDFAGASSMWARTPALQERMKVAARGAKVPVFFIQAANDFDTTPSRTLHEEMLAAHKPSRLHIFPAKGATHEEGHSFCTGGTAPPWGPEVLEFLDANMKP